MEVYVTGGTFLRFLLFPERLPEMPAAAELRQSVSPYAARYAGGMNKKNLVVAILSQTLVTTSSTGERRPAGRVRVFPAGEFRSVDGRPADTGAWRIDADAAQKLIDAQAAKQTATSIDYEHQTLNTVSNGQPVPAAGWFERLEWVEGDGLYAIDVSWTPAAAKMIADDEYRYISPVFSYDQKTGEITSLFNIALTNSPGLELPGHVMAALSSRLSTQQPEMPMDEEQLKELLNSLRWILNLPATSTAADIQAELEKIIAHISGGEGTAATRAGILTLLCEQEAKITVLSAQKPQLPDPAQFVPITALTAVQQELAAALTGNARQEAEGLIQAALSERRLVPGMEEWAREYASRDLAGFKNYLDSAPSLAALAAMQSRGVPVAGQPGSPLSGTVDCADRDLVAMCAQFGTDPKAIAKMMEKQTNG